MADITLRDLFGIGVMLQCPIDSGFAQQMQHRIGRAVAVIGRVVGVGIGESILRMKAGQLINSFITLLDE